MRDFISKYGAPLHMGYINPSDFNYPNDFHAFEQPGMGFQDISDNVIYDLRGPLEVTPIGTLVGPILGAPDSFTTLFLHTGKFRYFELGTRKCLTRGLFVFFVINDPLHYSGITVDVINRGLF